MRLCTLLALTDVVRGAGARRHRHVDQRFEQDARCTSSTRQPGLAPRSSGSFGGSIVRTIVGLLIVIAVIYGLAWILRQATRGAQPVTGDGLDADRLAAARRQPVGRTGPRRRRVAPARRRRARRHQHPRCSARRRPTNSGCPSIPEDDRYVRRLVDCHQSSACLDRSDGSRSGRAGHVDRGRVKIDIIATQSRSCCWSAGCRWSRRCCSASPASAAS